MNSFCAFFVRLSLKKEESINQAIQEPREPREPRELREPKELRPERALR